MDFRIDLDQSRMVIFLQSVVLTYYLTPTPQTAKTKNTQISLGKQPLSSAERLEVEWPFPTRFITFQQDKPGQIVFTLPTHIHVAVLGLSWQPSGHKPSSLNCFPKVSVTQWVAATMVPVMLELNSVARTSLGTITVSLCS